MTDIIELVSKCALKFEEHSTAETFACFTVSLILFANEYMSELTGSDDKIALTILAINESESKTFSKYIYEAIINPSKNKIATYDELSDADKKKIKEKFDARWPHQES